MKSYAPLAATDLASGLERHADSPLNVASLPVLMGNAFFADLVNQAGVGVLASATVEQLALGSLVGDGDRSNDADRSFSDKITDIGWDERREQDEFGPGREDETLFFDPGKGSRPEIEHDHGFLDDGSHGIDESLREEPTAADYALLAACIAAVESAELLRPDLVDATAAARHYLGGGGASRDPELERFFAADNSGRTILASVLDDAEQGAVGLHAERMFVDVDHPNTSPMSLQMQPFEPVVVGTGARFPYPATENWQKALGGFSLWASAEFDVTVDEAAWTRTIDMVLHIEMEDIYNFNPGQGDITTGLPDAVFGRLQVVGLGAEFLQIGKAERDLSFTRAIAAPECDPDHPDTIGGGEDPSGRPDGSRPFPHT